MTETTTTKKKKKKGVQIKIDPLDEINIDANVSDVPADAAKNWKEQKIETKNR